MQDYNELIEALRHCGSGECKSCVYRDKCGERCWRGYSILDGLRKEAADAIEALQAELNSRKIYGYTVDKLIMFAKMCERNDVQERDLKQAAWNMELAVRAVMNERQEIIKNVAGEITMRCTPDFDKAFKEMRDGAKMEVQDGK